MMNNLSTRKKIILLFYIIFSWQ